MSTLRARRGVSLAQILSVVVGLVLVGSSAALGLGVGVDVAAPAGVPVLASIPAVIGLVLFVAAYRMF